MRHNDELDRVLPLVYTVPRENLLQLGEVQCILWLQTVDLCDEVCCDSQLAEERCCPSPAPETSCCDSAAPAVFRDFMKEANRPGLIDGRAKKLMAIALSISQRCEPCLAIHMRSAISMGISKSEIDEAANLAIAFGGCTAMMFYTEVCDKLKI